MKKRFFLVVLTIIGLECFSQQLKIALIEYSPYEFCNKGKPDGFTVLIASEAFRRAGITVEYIFLPWNRALIYLENGTIDGLFEILKTPERETFTDYCTEILMIESTSFFSLKTNNIQYDGTIQSIANCSIGVISGFSYGNAFDTAKTNGMFTKMIMAENTRQCVLMLLAGRFDILAGDTLSVIAVLKTISKCDQVENIGTINNIPSYMAFSKKNKLLPIRDAFDKSLKSMKNDGTYYTLLKNYQ